TGGGVQPVKPAAQIVFVVAGRLQNRVVDVCAVHPQPADQIGIFGIQFAVGRQDRGLGLGVGGGGRRGAGLGVCIGIGGGGQRINGDRPHCHRSAGVFGGGGGFGRSRQHGRGGRFGLAAAEHPLPHPQHGGQAERRQTAHPEQGGLPALA